jgi:hypothetical protein
MCLDFQASKSLSKIITGDLNMGLWVWPRNQATVISVEEPMISMTKEARQVCSNMKGTPTAGWGPPNPHSRSCALWISSQGQTVNQHYYVDTWQYLGKYVGVWFLHHDNVSPLTLLCLCMNFWLKAMWLSFHTLPSQQI